MLLKICSHTLLYAHYFLTLIFFNVAHFPVTECLQDRFFGFLEYALLDTHRHHQTGK